MRERGAVRVAERHVLGTGRDRRAQALERVGGVVSPGVEEVLGVIDNALPLGPAEVDGVHDHVEVLLARDLRHLLEMKAPGLADERHDGRERGDEHAQRVVLGSGDAAPTGHAEGADGRGLESDRGEQLEELLLLRVRRGEAGLDVVDAEPVEGFDDAHLLGGGEGHALPLHAVAEGGVVEMNGEWSLVTPFRRYGGSSEGCAGGPREATALGRGAANSLDLSCVKAHQFS